MQLKVHPQFVQYGEQGVQSNTRVSVFEVKQCRLAHPGFRGEAVSGNAP